MESLFKWIRFCLCIIYSKKCNAYNEKEDKVNEELIKQAENKYKKIVWYENEI